MNAPSQVIILGSGIIGLCSAYEVLKLSPTSETKVVLVEASPGNLIAGGASSYAGGFIACGSDCEYHVPLSGRAASATGTPTLTLSADTD
jgi:glycine/D-amino acid oxidase-like deaminating enzyme